MREPLRHADGLYRRKWGILRKLSECPPDQQISNFRELLPCVTLWIAALSEGDVFKILTHPHPLSCDVSSVV